MDATTEPSNQDSQRLQILQKLHGVSEKLTEMNENLNKINSSVLAMDRKMRFEEERIFEKCQLPYVYFQFFFFLSIVCLDV